MVCEEKYNLKLICIDNMNDINENLIYELKLEINFCICGCEVCLLKECSVDLEKGKFWYVVCCLDEMCGY